MMSWGMSYGQPIRVSDFKSPAATKRFRLLDSTLIEYIFESVQQLFGSVHQLFGSVHQLFESVH